MRDMMCFNSKKVRYDLLNKDVLLAKFSVDIAYSQICDAEQIGGLPAWIDDIGLFIRNRRAPKHRENINELLRLSGCDTLFGYLEVSHALSLIDTFWVKREGSQLCWEDVSLFTHPFDAAIARAAFEGGLHGKMLSTTSPEYGTDGSFAKCWIREGNTIRLLKRGSSGARNAGLEPYSEFYASQIIKEFTSNFVDYGLRSHNGRLCSVCDIFTSEEYGYLPYAALDKGNTDLQKVLRLMESLGFRDEVRRMFVIDAVILNEDRHKNNFGFVVSNETQSIVSMSPLFDHNISLLPYAEEGDLKDPERFLAEKGPKLDDDWVLCAKWCLDSETRKVLINLSDFEFEKHGKFDLPDWRLEALEKIIHENIQRILE